MLLPLQKKHGGVMIVALITIAIFSLVNALMLKALQMAQGDRA